MAQVQISNYGTRLWPFFHSYAVGCGGHAPPFSCPSSLFLVGFAQQSELWQQVMPNSHRYARLCPPCAASVWAVHLMVLTAIYGYRYAHQLSQVQVYVNRFWSCWSTWLGFHNAQRASYRGCQRMPPPVPKIKMARATSTSWFCLWLLQPIMATLCAPNGSKPIEFKISILDFIVNWIESNFLHSTIKMHSSLLSCWPIRYKFN